MRYALRTLMAAVIIFTVLAVVPSAEAAPPALSCPGQAGGMHLAGTTSHYDRPDVGHEFICSYSRDDLDISTVRLSWIEPQDTTSYGCPERGEPAEQGTDTSKRIESTTNHAQVSFDIQPSSDQSAGSVSADFAALRRIAEGFLSQVLSDAVPCAGAYGGAAPTTPATTETTVTTPSTTTTTLAAGTPSEDELDAFRQLLDEFHVKRTGRDALAFTDCKGSGDAPGGPSCTLAQGFGAALDIALQTAHPEVFLGRTSAAASDENRQTVRVAGFFAALDDTDGHAALPSVRVALPVILQLAYWAQRADALGHATEADKYRTASGRLLTLLVVSDLTARGVTL